MATEKISTAKKIAATSIGGLMFGVIGGGIASIIPLMIIKPKNPFPTVIASMIIVGVAFGYFINKDVSKPNKK